MEQVLNHLWQSTVFASAAAAACVILRKNHARTRYWLWLAASIKFLIPFSLLISAGDRVTLPVTPPPVSATAVTLLSATFSPAPALPLAAATPGPGLPWREAAIALWAAGTLFWLALWIRQALRLRAIERASVPLALDFPIPARITDTSIEPGIWGLFRPVLLLPAGLTGRLTPEQFRAILLHELCHVRHRDNLTYGLHMGICALFWFHPLVWWIGARLIEERERACDETVLAAGSGPGVYAESILRVCRFCLESPLPCAAGVTGSDLKRRIRQILSGRPSQGLSLGRKLMLAVAGLVILCLPLAVGFLRAQTLPPPPQYTYEVATIRPSNAGDNSSRIGPGPQGGLRAQNVTALTLITFAYDLREFQLEDVPAWVKNDGFDVSFTPDKPEAQFGPEMKRAEMESMFNRQRQRMQALLRDRFGLVLRVETRQLPYYSLTVAKGGHKLLAPSDPPGPPNLRTSRGSMSANSIYLTMMVPNLGSLVGRHVTNDTGLDGPFNFEMKWSADESGDGASIFTAITEQLGLKLEPKRGPVPVYVLEKITKPSEN